MRTSRIAVVLASSLSLGLAGCANPSSSIDDCPTPPAAGVGPGDSAMSGATMHDVARETDRFGKELVGMAADTAEACAAEVGYSWRVYEQDGEPFALTMDYRVERINVKIERGIVTDAYSG